MNRRFLSLGLIATFRGRYKTAAGAASYIALTAAITAMTLGYTTLMGPDALFQPLIRLVGSTAAFLSLFAFAAALISAVIQPLEIRQARSDAVAASALAQGADAAKAFRLHHIIRLALQPYLAAVVFGLSIHHARHTAMTLPQLMVGLALAALIVAGYALGWTYCLWRRGRSPLPWALVTLAVTGGAVALVPSFSAGARLAGSASAIVFSFAAVARLQRVPAAATIFLGHDTGDLRLRKLERFFEKVAPQDVGVVLVLLTAALLVRISVIPPFSLLGVTAVGVLITAPRYALQQADDPVVFFVQWANGEPALRWVATRAVAFTAVLGIVAAGLLAIAGISPASPVAAGVVYTALFGGIAHAGNLVFALSRGVFDRGTRRLVVSPLARMLLFMSGTVACSISIAPIVLGSAAIRIVVIAVHLAAFASVLLASRSLPHNNSQLI